MDDLPPNLPPFDDKGPNDRYMKGTVIPTENGVTLQVPHGAPANVVSINLTFDDVRRFVAAVNYAVAYNEVRHFMIEGDC